MTSTVENSWLRELSKKALSKSIKPNDLINEYSQDLYLMVQLEDVLKKIDKLDGIVEKVDQLRNDVDGLTTDVDTIESEIADVKDELDDYNTALRDAKILDQYTAYDKVTRNTLASLREGPMLSLLQDSSYNNKYQLWVQIFWKPDHKYDSIFDDEFKQFEKVKYVDANTNMSYEVGDGALNFDTINMQYVMIVTYGGQLYTYSIDFDGVEHNNSANISPTKVTGFPVNSRSLGYDFNMYMLNKSVKIIEGTDTVINEPITQVTRQELIYESAYRMLKYYSLKFLLSTIEQMREIEISKLDAESKGPITENALAIRTLTNLVSTSNILNYKNEFVKVSDNYTFNSDTEFPLNPVSFIIKTPIDLKTTYTDWGNGTAAKSFPNNFLDWCLIPASTWAEDTKWNLTIRMLEKDLPLDRIDFQTTQYPKKVQETQGDWIYTFFLNPKINMQNGDFEHTEGKIHSWINSYDNTTSEIQCNQINVQHDEFWISGGKTSNANIYFGYNEAMRKPTFLSKIFHTISVDTDVTVIITRVDESDIISASGIIKIDNQDYNISLMSYNDDVNNVERKGFGTQFTIKKTLVMSIGTENEYATPPLLNTGDYNPWYESFGVAKSQLNRLLDDKVVKFASPSVLPDDLDAASYAIKVNLIKQDVVLEVESDAISNNRYKIYDDTQSSPNNSKPMETYNLTFGLEMDVRNILISKFKPSSSINPKYTVENWRDMREVDLRNQMFMLIDEEEETTDIIEKQLDTLTEVLTGMGNTIFTQLAQMFMNIALGMPEIQVLQRVVLKLMGALETYNTIEDIEKQIEGKNWEGASGDIVAGVVNIVGLMLEFFPGLTDAQRQMP